MFCPQHIHLCPNPTSLLLHSLFPHLVYESLQDQNILLLLHAQKNILTPGPDDQSLQRNVLIRNGQHLFLSTQLAPPGKRPGIFILTHFIWFFWGTFMCITNYNISKQSSLLKMVMKLMPLLKDIEKSNWNPAGSFLFNGCQNMVFILLGENCSTQLVPCMCQYQSSR